MFIYRVADVIKTAFFISFVFILSIPVFSQNTESDSLALNESALTLLKEKIDFIWDGGNLKDALEKLSRQNNLNFAYSDIKIQNVLIEKKSFNSTEVSEVLKVLLKDSGFNYMIVGRSIVVVNKSPATDNSKSGKTDLSSMDDPNSHIYPVSPLLHKLSPYERNLLKSIYRKELNQRARKRKLAKSYFRDSLGNTKSIPPQSKPLKISRYFFKASLGWENYFLRYKNNSSLDWKANLNFRSGQNTVFLSEIGAGICMEYLMIETGLAYHRFNVNNLYSVDTALNKPALKKPKPAPVPAGSVQNSFSEKFTFFSLPVNIYFYRQAQILFGALGAGVTFNFLQRDSQKDVLKNYFENSLIAETYIEKEYKYSCAISLKGQAGLKASKRATIVGALDYNVYLSPFYENSIYKFSPNSLSLKISFYYFLNGKK